MPRKSPKAHSVIKAEEITTNVESKIPSKEKSPSLFYKRLVGFSVLLLLNAAFFWLFAQSFLQNENQQKEPTIEKANSFEKNSAELNFKASTWFSDYEAMKKVVHLYHNIHPFIYTLEGGLHNTGELLSTWSKKDRFERVKELRQLNPKVLIIPTIFRWENQKEKINEAIGMHGRKDILQKHIQAIIREIETYGYDGIDIDYEGMTCDKKENFENFIVLLSQELKKRKKILSVAVHPKTPLTTRKPYYLSCPGLKEKIYVDFKELWRGPLTHDYAFLAKYADKIKVMAYELHPRKYHNPGPGPQAPLYWLEQIIDYAKEKVSPDKLYMAIPTYGYDWALNCQAKAKSVYWSDVLRLLKIGAENHQPTNLVQIATLKKEAVNWFNLQKFLYIHKGKVYEDGSLLYQEGDCFRLAFYMNRQAFEEKMNLLRRHDLAGFSFWQLLSDNDPEINQYLSLLIKKELPPVLKVSPIKTTPIEEVSYLGQIPATHISPIVLPKTENKENFSGVTILEEDG